MSSASEWECLERNHFDSCSRENWTTTCQPCFDQDSSLEQGVGFDGLRGPFQLCYSMLLGSYDCVGSGKSVCVVSVKPHTLIHTHHLCVTHLSPACVIGKGSCVLWGRRCKVPLSELLVGGAGQRRKRLGWVKVVIGQQSSLLCPSAFPLVLQV